MPSVSVVIPCRNAAQWVGHAVASALGAEGVTEVIVVDDGSNDGSADIAARAGSAVTVLRLPPQGGNAARNAGRRAAHGEWVQFLDADDYLEPQKITRQFAEASNLDAADVLYSPVWIETWRDGHAVERVASQIDTATDVFTQWITWQLPQTGGALWRRDALERVGGWNDAMPCCQEHELYLRALRAGLRLRHCPSPGAVYRVWTQNTVSRKDPVLVVRTRTELITRMLAWLEETGRLRSPHRAAAGQVFFELARTWAHSDLSAAAAYYAEHDRRGLIRPRGPAAPPPYRAALAILGFRRTEEFTRRLRRAR